MSVSLRLNAIKGMRLNQNEMKHRSSESPCHCTWLPMVVCCLNATSTAKWEHSVIFGAVSVKLSCS